MKKNYSEEEENEKTQINSPQYHMTLSIPAPSNTSYKLGIESHKLCAGKLIDPRIVPPYIPPLPKYMSTYQPNIHHHTHLL